MNGNALPLTWWVAAEWGDTPATAIMAHLPKAQARLGGAPTTILLHPTDLAALGVAVQESRQDGKTYKEAAWHGLALVSIERSTKRGPASQVGKCNFWYGRDYEQDP